MKRRIKQCIPITIILVILILVVTFFFRIRLIKGGGVYVGNPLFNSYAYTVYFDHVVLEQFRGKEQEEIVLPTTIWGRPVTIIGWECFEQCDSIKKVVLHENIEVIEGLAFRNCDKLEEIVNGCNINEIKTQAFMNCGVLKSVELGNKLKYIGHSAFKKCGALKRINMQDNLVFIEDSAFTESGLEEFVFNNDVKVGSGAFTDTPWLRNQKEEFVIYGDGDLVWYNGNDSKVFIPHGVKTLLWDSFDGTSATYIYIPETVAKIEAFTFSACDNVKVYIPESVVEMGSKERDCSIVNNDAHITIVTIKDSYAHQYAIDHDIPYEIVESW